MRNRKENACVTAMCDVGFMQRKAIRFLNILSLRGPNIWTYRPVLEAWVDIGALEECPSNTLPGFVDRLCAWLPTLAGHRCSYDEPGGFVRRLQEGTWAAHILEHVTLELQNLAGIPCGFGKARETGVRGIYKVAVRARQEDVARACLHAARDLVMAAIEDTPFDVEATQQQLQELARKYQLGPNTACMVDAATAMDRGIPTLQLSADNLVQLGYGSRQRRIWAAETDRTSAIAEGITRNSELTRRLLKACALPVADADKGEPEGGGHRHRLLVVGDTLVAAARLDVGAENFSLPHTAADVTDQVHPETAAAACLAARVIGLDIAGVDLVAHDIACPLVVQDGAITAVHACPGLLTHLQPASGEPRPVGRAIIDHLFPNGDTGRIPVVGVTGSSGTTEVARLVAEFLRLSGKITGLACADGLFLNRRRIDASDCGNWQSGRRLLMNCSAEAVVIENGADVILGQGLAYDRCQIAVVTRIDPARHFGKYHIDRPEQVFQVFRSQVDVVLRGGVAVLDAADPMMPEMLPLCDGEVILFAIDPTFPAILEHRSRGGRAVFVRGDGLVLGSATDEASLVPLTEILLIAEAPSNEHLESVLAAVAAAWALGIAHHVIRTGVQTFSPDSNANDGTHPTTPDPITPHSMPTHA